MAKTAQHKGSPESESDVLVPRYRSVSQRRVWLTFDDGPHPVWTEKILRILDSQAILATFFIVGKRAAAHPEVLKKIAHSGHWLGNHSYSHLDLTRLSKSQIRSQIQRTERLIAPYLNPRRGKFFRPPYGRHNQVVDRIASELGYRLYFWNVDTLDWDKQYQPDRWAQYSVDQIRDRDTAIVLMHDIHKTTADNLSAFISRIKALGEVRFEPSVDVSLRDTEERDEAVEAVIEASIEAERSQKSGKAALEALRAANTKLTEVDLSTAAPGALAALERQLDAIVRKATELKAKMLQYWGFRADQVDRRSNKLN